jgi:hypothetical protein
MTTLTTEVPGNLFALPADDPEARDRKKQWLEQEYRRRALLVLEDLERAGLVASTSPRQVDVVIHEKDSGRVLLVEMKFSPEPIEDDALRELARAVAEAPASLAPDEAEQHYQALGRFKGPLAAEEVQRNAREYWNKAGTAGARWLVARLRSETHEERLHWAASILASLGHVSIGPILEALRGDAPPDQALALLRALGWLARRETTADLFAELALVKHLFDDNPDVREAACSALRLLAPAQAQPWLNLRLREETDDEVRRTIEEALGLIQAARAD